jgi:7-cyano-7-deazaguanine tRNA-ribosyltransferase
MTGDATALAQHPGVGTPPGVCQLPAAPLTSAPAVGRVARIGRHTVTVPMMWLGHDLKSRLRVWRQVHDNLSGILISAHQVLMRDRRFRQRFVEQGLRSCLGFAGPIFLDSGGFHFQQQGSTSVAVDELMLAYSELQPDLVAVLDLPLHPRASIRENSRRWRQTVANTERMLERRGLPPLAIVIHSYNLGHVERRCQELRNLVPHPLVVCIGSLVPILRARGVGKRFGAHGSGEPPTHQRWRFIARLIQRVRNNFPTALLHVFGAGTLSTIWLLYLLGVDSVDSVAWRLKAAYGAIRLPGLADRYVTDLLYTRSRRKVSTECRELLRSCNCSACDGFALPRRVEILAESFEARAVHNAHVFSGELALFRRALAAGHQLQFVRARLADNPLYLGLLEKVLDPQFT